MLPHGNDSWLWLTVALISQPALSSGSDRETIHTAFLAAQFLLLDSHVRRGSHPRWWALIFDLHEFRDDSSILPLHRGWEP